MTAAVTAGGAPHGRTTISPRAVRRVVSAVTADALSVTTSDVSVDVTDEGGALAVTARAPIHVAPLGLDARRGESVLDRLGRAQADISSRSRELTGSTLSRVDLKVTGAKVQEKGRVS